MANYWTDPKINWATSDGIGYEDLNRIEANIRANRDANFRRVQGFGYSISNTISGQDGVITINPGSAYSTNGFPIRSNSAIVKNLQTWGQGSGAAFGGMRPGVTLAAFTWYYAFAVMNPADGSVEIQFDTEPTGASLSSGLFTEKRFIGSFRTGGIGFYGSFKLSEMYSLGDRVIINPNSLNTPGRDIAFTGFTNNTYKKIDLGSQLPNREVMASLSVRLADDDITALGAMSEGSGFTLPTAFETGGVYTAEFLHLIKYTPIVNGQAVVDFDLRVNAAGELNLAVTTSSGIAISIAVRGFKDERLL